MLKTLIGGLLLLGWNYIVDAVHIRIVKIELQEICGRIEVILHHVSGTDVVGFDVPCLA